LPRSSRWLKCRCDAPGRGGAADAGATRRLGRTQSPRTRVDGAPVPEARPQRPAAHARPAPAGREGAAAGRSTSCSRTCGSRRSARRRRRRPVALERRGRPARAVRKLPQSSRLCTRRDGLQDHPPRAALRELIDDTQDASASASTATVAADPLVRSSVPKAGCASGRRIRPARHLRPPLPARELSARRAATSSQPREAPSAENSLILAELLEELGEHERHSWLRRAASYSVGRRPSVPRVRLAAAEGRDAQPRCRPAAWRACPGVVERVEEELRAR